MRKKCYIYLSQKPKLCPVFKSLFRVSKVKPLGKLIKFL